MVPPGLVAAVLVVGAVALAILAFLAAALAIGPPEDDVAPDPPFEEVVVPRAEAPDLAGWWVPSTGETDSAVLCLHGHPRSKEAIWDTVAFLREDHHLLLVDLRAHGDSEGTFTTFGKLEVRDVQAALSYLQDRDEVERMGAWGVSMGAAAILLARDPRLDAAVVEAPFAELKSAVNVPGPHALTRVIRGLFTTLAYLLLNVDVDEIRPVEAAADLPFPVLLVQGTEDRTVPVEQGRRIAEAGGDRVEAWFVEGAGHDACKEADPQAYEDRVGGFLREHLAPDQE